jgi:hypothetical protein
MTAKARPLIRLPKASYATLKALSKQEKKPMSDLAAEAIERYSDDRFWDEVDRELEAMTPEQWRRYRKEFKEWETFAGDTDLPAEDWSDEWRAQQQRAKAKAGRGVVVRPGSGTRTRARRAATVRRRVV